MRRSAAPSSQSAAKRLRFLSPFLNPSFEIDDNDIFNNPSSKCSNSVHKVVPNKVEVGISTLHIFNKYPLTWKVSEIKDGPGKIA